MRPRTKPLIGCSPDPDRAIISRFEAKNGGYVVLLRPEGAIDAHWPGCSAEMMRELGRRIAELAAVTERAHRCLRDARSPDHGLPI